MSKRKIQTQLSPDGPAPDDLAQVDEEDAPPAPPEAPHDDAAPMLAPSAEPPPAEPPGPPAWRDFPVASILPPVAPLLPPTPAVSPLEDRLYRLEAELARLHAAPPPHAPPAAPDSAASVVRPPGGFWGGFGKGLLAPSGPSAAPPTKPNSLASMVPPGVRRTWALFDALRDLRAMYCMYFDPRYRLSWFGRLAPLLIVVLIVTSSFWMPGTGLLFPIGLVIDKVADLILAYFLFKLLSHEARRYRETAPDLPPSLRL